MKIVNIFGSTYPVLLPSNSAADHKHDKSAKLARHHNFETNFVRVVMMVRVEGMVRMAEMVHHRHRHRHHHHHHHHNRHRHRHHHHDGKFAVDSVGNTIGSLMLTRGRANPPVTPPLSFT